METDTRCDYGGVDATNEENKGKITWEECEAFCTDSDVCNFISFRSSDGLCLLSQTCDAPTEKSDWVVYEKTCGKNNIKTLFCTRTLRSVLRNLFLILN